MQRVWTTFLLTFVLFVLSAASGAAQVTSVTVLPSPASPQAAGGTITFTAQSSGGTAPVQFKWYLSQNGGQTFDLVQNWSTSATWQWTPQASGNQYQIGIWARSAGNSTDIPEAVGGEAYAINTAPVPGTVNWGLSGTSLFYFGGNVGIGTASPAGRLQVGRALTTVADAGGLVLGSGTGAGGARQYWMGATNPNNSNNNAFVIGDYGYEGALAFTPYVTIHGQHLGTMAGNVGIGTTAPSARLHVAGNVVVDGNIGAKYQDVAEWVDADTSLPSGTVVIADPNKSNHVRASASPYDTAVAGVISAQPGILLGEKGVGKVAVAQSGRVRVKVDASFGAVQRGDLLVTSAKPGYAMRSEPMAVGDVHMHRPGTIIGKALEPLSAGTGDVLTLLTLQ